MTKLYMTEFLATIVFVACLQGILTSRIKRQVIDTGIYQWAHWTQWSTCNATCAKDNGVGKQSRTRQCINDEDDVKIIHCQVPYTGDGEGDEPIRDVENSHVIIKRASHLNDPKHYDAQYQTCHANCPRLGVDGGWSQWMQWTQCTTNRSPNVRIRSRMCNSPQPSNGGQYCVGAPSEKENCASNVWSDWSAYTSCSVSCGTGRNTRTRTCTTGNDCTGSNTDEKTCTMTACPVDGIWGAWSTYTKCSVSCGNGVMYRWRSCDSPAPTNGGQNCSGLANEFKACHAQECPIDGGWSSSTELACSTTCGIGVQTTYRTCTNPAPAHGGKNCSGAAYSFKHCNNTPCAIDGGWSNYTELACSTTCGVGVQTSFRSCSNPAPANGGKNCTGAAYSFTHCNKTPCAIDGGWSNYTQLACSTSCGLGVQASFRTCTNPAPAYGGKNCTGSTHQFIHCQLENCPIDGGWGNWTVWSTCSVTAGFGAKTRSRTCTAPAPQYGGKDCVGDATDSDSCVVNQWSVWSAWSSCDATCGNATRSRHRSCHTGSDCIGEGREYSQCNLTVCYSDKAYSAWSNWGDCSVTCGQGISSRTRACHSEFEDAHDCVNEFLEKRDCHMAHCPIDGGFGNWTNWSECSTTCGNGSMQRTRQCDSPMPQYGGQNCEDGPSERQYCKVKECPIDGGWSSFVNQSCSVTCGTGTVIAIRACTNPIPKFGGKTCDGNYNETSTCEEAPCPIDGDWTTWSDWGACDKTCGNGTQARSRSCSNPTPQYGGQNCLGDVTETQACFEVECPIDGGWREFVNQSCSVTCGTGIVVAVRACDNPPPAFGGKPCDGAFHKTYTCVEEPCAIVGGWSDWTAIGQCSSVCGQGHVTKTRTCTNPAPAHGGNNCTGEIEERVLCESGNCSQDIRLCNKDQVHKILNDTHLYSPIMPPPCSNMDFIPQEAMLKDVCNATDDANQWKTTTDIRSICDSLPLYSPVTKVHRAYNTREYGVVLDCANHVLKIATETCTTSVHEVVVDLREDGDWDYFMTSW